MQNPPYRYESIERGTHQWKLTAQFHAEHTTMILASAWQKRQV